MMINFKNVINKISEIENKKKKINKILLTKNYKKKKHNLGFLQVQKHISKKLPPNLEQLNFIYNIVKKFKRVTVLEFGVGWSTYVISKALVENNEIYKDEINLLRFSNPFEIHSIDNYKKYIKSTLNILEKNQKKKTFFYYSKVSMTKLNNKICTEYKKLPKINPDLIFIDGPSQYNVKGDINNFKTSHPDLSPMSCDLLKIEPFLKPGTIVLIDGRTLNYLFLKEHFYRNWNYKYLKKYDLHFLFLNGPVLGDLNIKQLQFYKLR